LEKQVSSNCRRFFSVDGKMHKNPKTSSSITTNMYETLNYHANKWAF
jgi:hypothetical protein